MGCTYSRITKSVSYSVLRKSVLGALLPDDDFNAFYNICRTDAHTLTSQITINQYQLFYVVVAGEVAVNLTQSDSRPKQATVYKPGEMIHFFHGTDVISTDGTISSGNVKLSLSFVTLTTPAVIIGAERSAVEDFLRPRPHLTKLKQLLNLNLANFLTGQNSAHFRSLTYKQLNILGPLLKIRLSVNQERIKFSGKESGVLSPISNQKTTTSHPLINLTSPSNTTNKQKQWENETLNNHFKSPLRGRQVFSPVFVVLHGLVETAEVEPTSVSIRGGMRLKPGGKKRFSIVLSSLRSNNSSSSYKYNKVHTSNGVDDTPGSPLPLVTIPTSPSNNNLNDVSIQSHSKMTPGSSQSPRHRSYGAGTVVGLEHFLVGKPIEGLMDHRVVGDFAILAHLDLDMLKVLTSVDRRLQRVFSRNFIMKLLDGFRDHVPMISDMDEKAYTMLCSTIVLKSFNPGDIIYKQGDNSTYAYIIVHGGVMETTEIMALSMSTINKSASYSPHANQTTQPGGHQPAQPVQPPKKSLIEIALTHDTHAGPVTSTLPVEDPPAPVISSTKLLGISSLFGEVSLVTETPYPSTTQALEPTLLVAISKNAFNEIYNNNKASLAEIRIRMAGCDIGLQPILDHPVGFKMFQDFVEENRAGENLLFYSSADKFDDMCSRLKKQMLTLRSSGGSMKHNLTSGRLGANSIMYDGDMTIDLRTINKAESGPAAPSSPVNAVNGSGGATMLETISEHHSVASETIASEKRRNASTDDMSLSHKKSSLILPVPEEESEMNGESAGGISDKSSLVNGAVGGATGSVSPSPVPEGLLQQPLTQSQSQSPIPQASAKSNNNMIRLAPLVIDNNNNNNSNYNNNYSNNISPTDMLLDDMLLCEQDTYLANANYPNSLTNSLHIGSSSNANSFHQSNLSTAGNNSSGRVTDESSPVKEENTKMTKLKYQKIERTTVELQEVARTIMERYINEGSPCEINIPQSMRTSTQQIFEDWICTHNALGSNSGSQKKESRAPFTGLTGVDGQPSPNGTFHSTATFGNSPTKENEFSFNSAKIKRHMNTPFFQLDFCDMFSEPKQEILKMLKGDLFMRWKKTKDFQFFITNLKPYEDVSMHSNHSRSSLVSELNRNDGNGSQQNSLRRVLNSTGISRENSLRNGLKKMMN